MFFVSVLRTGKKGTSKDSKWIKMRGQIQQHIIHSLLISLILCDTHLYDTIPHEQGVDGGILKQTLLKVYFGSRKHLEIFKALIISKTWSHLRVEAQASQENGTNAGQRFALPFCNQCVLSSMSLLIYNTISLGNLQAPTSSWRPLRPALGSLGLIDFILCDHATAIE